MKKSIFTALRSPVVAPGVGPDTSGDLLNNTIWLGNTNEDLNARLATRRKKEKAVAADPVARAKYWKVRRQQGRRRVAAHAGQDAKRGFRVGAGVSMAAAGMALGAGGGFGESPQAWVRRQAMQGVGGKVADFASKAPKGLKTWHLVAAPVVAGTAGGAAVGAIRGLRKKHNPWYSSREHSYSVRKAYGDTISQGKKRKSYDHIIPKGRRGLKESRRSDLRVSAIKAYKRMKRKGNLAKMVDMKKQDTPMDHVVFSVLASKAVKGKKAASNTYLMRQARKDARVARKRATEDIHEGKLILKARKWAEKIVRGARKPAKLTVS
jgi:hypothetical protein